MTLRWPWFYVKALLRNLFSGKAVTAVLSVFGALWLVVEMATFFFPTTIVFGTTALPDALRSSWLFFLVGGLVNAIWQCKPRLSVTHKLKGRDVSIEISAGDVFSFPGALIMGSNTTFDTHIPAVISKKSVQGSFTQRYYDGDAQLEAEISAQLQNVPFEDLPGTRAGNAKKYPMGTCVTLQPRNRIGYLLAIANINEHGTASGTFEDLKNSLAKLWEYVGTRGSKEPLLIPVLGTGFARLPHCREEIVQEIIKSFIAACTERTFTEKLTVVITPNDILNYGISLDQLGSFLKHQCNYTIFSGSNKPALGTAV